MIVLCSSVQALPLYGDSVAMATVLVWWATSLWNLCSTNVLNRVWHQINPGLQEEINACLVCICARTVQWVETVASDRCVCLCACVCEEEWFAEDLCAGHSPISFPVGRTCLGKCLCVSDGVARWGTKPTHYHRFLLLHDIRRDLQRNFFLGANACVWVMWQTFSYVLAPSLTVPLPFAV